jgi:uridine kinase
MQLSGSQHLSSHAVPKPTAPVPALTVALAIVELAHSATPPPGMRCKVIAIDGCGGAGKSVLAERVSELLGGAPIVHTDDFASWENPVDWWPRLLEQVLSPLAANRPARYQAYDWETRRLTEWHEIAPGEFLVLDGVSASRHAFREHLALTVWVQTPRAERLRRGLARDGQHARDQWLGWMAEEDAYVQRGRPDLNADLVVSGTD